MIMQNAGGAGVMAVCPGMVLLDVFVWFLWVIFLGFMMFFYRDKRLMVVKNDDKKPRRGGVLFLLRFSR